MLLLPDTTSAAQLTDALLRRVSAYAAALGLAKITLAPTQSDGACKQPSCSSLQTCTGKLREARHLPGTDQGPSPGALAVQRAHKAGLLVHVWTFRNELFFMPLDFHADPAAEVAYFVDELGVDGVFADNPATARAAISCIEPEAQASSPTLLWLGSAVTTLLLLHLFVLVGRSSASKVVPGLLRRSISSHIIKY